MKRFVIILTLCIASQFSLGQTLTPEEAAKRVGDSIKVCGKIFGGRYFENANNAPTLLNMGAAFPNSPLTIVIYADTRKKLAYQPEVELVNKNVCVTGTVVLYREKPQIVIRDVSQIVVE
jgi:hypothetical protein